MYKITFTVFSILIFAFNGYSADNKSKNNVENKKAETTIKAPDMSFNDDYFVGLKAYDDGLYDVAEYCLANYLKYENKSQKQVLQHICFIRYICCKVTIKPHNIVLLSLQILKTVGLIDKKCLKTKCL